MEIAILERLINNRFTQRQISKQLNLSQTTIRYWLKKYNLKTKRGPKGKLPKDYIKPRHCKCGEIDPTKFYGNKSQICARCHNRDNLERGHKNRSKSIEILGGCCSRCKYNQHHSAFDIHHLNPKEKDPGFKTMRYWSWNKIEKELKSCILLCANCHRIEHSNEHKV